jgi:hypothetical protein
MAVVEVNYKCYCFNSQVAHSQIRTKTFSCVLQNFFQSSNKKFKVF